MHSANQNAQPHGVLFVEIDAPSIDLPGPAVARDLAALIGQAQAESSVQIVVFRSTDLSRLLAAIS